MSGTINYEQRLSEIAAAKRRLIEAEGDIKRVKHNLEMTDEFVALQEAKAEKKEAETLLESLLSGVAWGMQPSMFDGDYVVAKTDTGKSARIVSVEQ
jgi:hypothetical protein